MKKFLRIIFSIIIILSLVSCDCLLSFAILSLSSDVVAALTEKPESVNDAISKTDTKLTTNFLQSTKFTAFFFQIFA